MHIPDATFAAIPQGLETTPLSGRYYAQLVHQVNSTSLSGTVTTEPTSEVYSRIVQTRSTDTYIAHAPVGSLSGDSVWRVQKIDTDGSRLWADGGLFSQAASGELSGLTYAF
jgi:hypothetical protein